MKRTTVKLPDELDARLRHEAQRRGRTVSELTREAIDLYLGGLDRQGKRRLLAAGAGRSGHPDVSERIEEILLKELPASPS
jgi:predicted transcriptional regulator